MCNHSITCAGSYSIVKNNRSMIYIGHQRCKSTLGHEEIVHNLDTITNLLVKESVCQLLKHYMILLKNQRNLRKNVTQKYNPKNRGL